jgi:hypothetical protein
MADQDDLKKLADALQAGKRVEIDRYVGGASASLPVASENARRASEANARGERVVRISGADGERDYECGATLDQVAELIKAGAIEL